MMVAGRLPLIELRSQKGNAPRDAQIGRLPLKLLLVRSLFPSGDRQAPWIDARRAASSEPPPRRPAGGPVLS